MPQAKPQLDMFASNALPAGFRYLEDVLSDAEERDFAQKFADQPFQPFQFHGYLGNRRVVSYGWRYDYSARVVRQAEVIPDFLTGLKRRASDFTKIPADAFEQILITEYAPGAGIGWHRDKPQFGEIVAFSFLSTCPLRFRRASEAGWERQTHCVQPRSAYVVSGPSRWEWEHSIAPLQALRYAVTMRTLAKQTVMGS